MTKEELLERLEECRWAGAEAGHADADEALIKYIGDDDITAAFTIVPKWYA